MLWVKFNALWGLIGCLIAGSAVADLPSDAVLAQVSSQDVVREGRQVHALLAGRPHDGPGVAVYYLHSEDEGEHWSMPQRVDPPGAAALESRSDNSVQIAAHAQQRVAAWQQHGELPGNGPIAVFYSADAGRSWQAGDNPAPGDALHNQGHLDLAVDATGRFHISWLDDREESGDAQGLRHAVSDDGGRHWHAETTVDARVCTCCWSRLSALPNGDMAVLYRDEAPRDMALARYRRGRWQRLSTVGAFNWQFQGCPHCGGSLAAHRRHLHSVVWTGAAEQAGLYYMRSRDGGWRWSTPQRLAEPNARLADIAASSRRRLAVVYTEVGPGGVVLKLRRSRNGGRQWSTPEVLSSAQADAPRIVALRHGIRVFWTDKAADGQRRWRTLRLP